MGVKQKAARFLVWRTRQALREELGREPSDYEIAAVLGWNPDAARRNSFGVFDEPRARDTDEPEDVVAFFERNS